MRAPYGCEGGVRGYGTFPGLRRKRHAVQERLRLLLDQQADDCARLAAARHGDPFAVLGPLRRGDALLVTAFLPDAVAVSVDGDVVLERYGDTDIFAWLGEPGRIPVPYRLHWRDGRGVEHVRFDPYCLPPCLPDEALVRFGAGQGGNAWRWLGAHRVPLEGLNGVRFAVWAPNAKRVSVVGDFNGWDGRRHPMRLRIGHGVWELFIPDLGDGLYKFEILTQAGDVIVKTDPYGTAFEHRPATAAYLPQPSRHVWRDAEWLERRAATSFIARPMSIYEVHLGSWRRRPDGGFLTYRELAPLLATHVSQLGFTHVELLPIMEHPLDESWGYQTTGYFAPTSRHGSPDDLRFLVDYLHRCGIGVLLDWVPGHFPRDSHALARFDGGPLYEYADPRRGEHREWGTYIFDYGRNEVRSFLYASAAYWLEEFHFDGLRVDAVASMLYLDYARPAGEWQPNEHGGRDNLEAVAFLRGLNTLVHSDHPGAVMIAEESTAWAGVTAPVADGGLGFDLKWNMGWMHDTLAYFREDALFRRYHHHRLTFGITYAWSERFVLPFSHDEVVHLKRSLLGRMPGDDWQAHANLRLLYAWAFLFPGKKLLFMGAELAARGEWNSGAELPWDRLAEPQAGGIATLLTDLNGLYRQAAALHASDHDPDGFRWLDADDALHSIYAFERRAGAASLVVALNLTPLPRPGYRLGLPAAGEWTEILNTDSRHYGGGDVGNAVRVAAAAVPAQGRPFSALVTLPPLGALVLAPAGSL
jgi:1,4-alpha-glucan branching enzyme